MWWQKINKAICGNRGNFEILSLRFRVDAQGSFQGEVHLHTPPTAHAGATVSLTLNVRDLKSPDSNYAVAYLTVVPLVSIYLKQMGYFIYTWVSLADYWSLLCSDKAFFLYCIALTSLSFLCRILTRPLHSALLNKCCLPALLLAISQTGLFLWLCQIGGTLALLLSS